MNPHVVVITGATRGLGRALTQRLVAMGHTVAGCGRSLASIDALRQASGPTHDFEVVDVTQGAAVSQWAEKILARLGPPDFLINNAAIINPNQPLWEVSEQEFSDVIDVNIKGVANVLRAFVPDMVRRQSGVIVNFSSGWGRYAEAEVAPYCATKFAIEGLTQALARELPPGMVAIPLNPGVIDTDMLRSCFGGEASSYQSPEEWAQKAAPFILGLRPDQTGQSLSIS